MRVAINGYGRIGRAIIRAWLQGPYRDTIDVVAINDLAPIETHAHLTRYDSTFGPLPFSVEVRENQLFIDDRWITVFSERDPANLPWERLGVDVVLECSGHFTQREKAAAHQNAGAKRVLISAPATGVDGTIVYGVNHQSIGPETTILSNASCTTNCLAPVSKLLHETCGIRHGLMTTVHSYTNDQALLDTAHSDLRRARAAAHSMIPTKTGAAVAVGLVLPELAGRLDGFAIRVPTMNVSVVDLTVQVENPVDVNTLNAVMKEASDGVLNGVLAYNDAPLVSVDFNQNPASSVFDATQTRVMGNLVKVLSWYDNEYGFANRMLDTAWTMMAAS